MDTTRLRRIDIFGLPHASENDERARPLRSAAILLSVRELAAITEALEAYGADHPEIAERTTGLRSRLDREWRRLVRGE